MDSEEPYGLFRAAAARAPQLPHLEGRPPHPRSRPTQPGARRPRWCALRAPWEELRSSSLMCGLWPGRPSHTVAPGIVLDDRASAGALVSRGASGRAPHLHLEKPSDRSSEARITRRRRRRSAACVTTSSADTTCEACGRRTTERRSRGEKTSHQDRGLHFHNTHSCLCVQLLHCTAQPARQ